MLLFEIEAQPPQAAIISVTIVAEPVKPRMAQTGLFIPLAPEPEKLELTLARLAKLVGADKVGSPEILDTHRPDAFRMNRFSISNGKNKSRRHRQLAEQQWHVLWVSECFDLRGARRCKPCRDSRRESAPVM